MLSNYTFLIVLLGVLLLGVNASIVGAYNYLQKKSLLADVVSHSVLPGICLGFLMTGEKNIFFLLLGALTTGGLAIFLVDMIRRHSILKEDSIMATILSFFFGLGIVLLTYIQNNNYSNQSGLNTFLLGQASSLLISDVFLISSNTILILGCILLFGRVFLAASFDPNFLKQTGIPLGIIQLILNTLTILTIAIGIQAVGIVLIAAIMITPIAIGSLWDFRFERMVLVGILANVIACFWGTYISFIYPHAPTGPWVVVILSLLFLLSLLFGTKSKMRLIKKT